MTIPTQHSCPHSPEGWCLDCVQKLGAENERLRHQNNLYRAMRRIDAPTPADVGQCQRETLEMLVISAWRHVDISAGRAAEILGMCLQDFRDEMAKRDVQQDADPS